MGESTTVYLSRPSGQGLWRAEVPIAGFQTGVLVGWQTIEHYMRIFGWHPTAFRPVRCCCLSPQELTLTAVEVRFVRQIPPHPEREGIGWQAATSPGGRPHGSH